MYLLKPTGANVRINGELVPEKGIKVERLSPEMHRLINLNDLTLEEIQDGKNK